MRAEIRAVNHLAVVDGLDGLNYKAVVIHVLPFGLGRWY